MGTSFKEKAETVLDAAGFTAVTMVMYLCMASTLPLTQEGDSFLGSVLYFFPFLKPYFSALVFASIWPLLFTGAWLKRWAPGLSFGEIRSYLAAFALVLWAGPMRDLRLFDGSWMRPDRFPRAAVLLAAAFLALFLSFRLLAETEGEGSAAPRTDEFMTAVVYWFFGWTLFFAFFAGLNMKALFEWGSTGRPFILIGITMAYWSFLLGLKVRAQTGQGMRGWFAWGTLLAGLWTFSTVVLWVTFTFWL